MVNQEYKSPLTTGRPALVRVAIPHYCLPLSDQDIGYGSSRAGADVFRGVALGRCLGSVLALARHPREQLLSIKDATVVNAPPSEYPKCQLTGVVIDCHIFVTGDCWLQRDLSAFDGRVTVHQLQLNDPKRLPHAARDFLLCDDAAGDADLSLYLEDDLVVHDRLYIDKLIWFLERTNHSFGLMPHRYELTADPSSPRFFVDGPINTSIFPAHQVPKERVASGRFWDNELIWFDITDNPHSGSFCFSAPQRAFLLNAGVVDEGFIGPLETVATYTLLKHLPIMKPSWPFRDFLSIEHAHPSYLYMYHRFKSKRGLAG